MKRHCCIIQNHMLKHTAIGRRRREPPLRGTKSNLSEQFSECAEGVVFGRRPNSRLFQHMVTMANVFMQQRHMKLFTTALAGLALAALTASLSAAPPAPAPTAPAADTTGGWIGRAAPTFTLPSSQGAVVDMGKVIGTRPVVLIFYRGVWCPFCQAQMTQIGKDRDAFQKSGAAVYAISDEDPAAQKKMQTEHGLDFITFLSDKTGTAARQYAGVYSGRTTLKPAVFVIGRNRKIKYAYINENFRLRAADQDILKAIGNTPR
jgi:peroxiredoxin